MNEVIVEILLATYNGEKYLSAQLESILQQSFQDIRILIRDDGSTDSTMSIIQKFVNNHSSKIRLIPKTETTRGPIHNFSKLITASTAPYLMLSDQDDVWLPNKIDLLLTRLQHLEQEYSNQLPILVHSDMYVVDQDLHVLGNSFWKYIGVNPNRKAFANLLIQNNVTGCAAIFNRALADLCGPIPEEAMMHDWWLALIASSIGIIDSIDIPTILYRQHNMNTLGAQHFSLKLSYLIEKTRKILSPDKYILTDYIQQADSFYSNYEHFLSETQRDLLNIFRAIQNQNFIERRKTMIQYGFTKAPLIKNIGLLINI